MPRTKRAKSVAVGLVAVLAACLANHLGLTTDLFPNETAQHRFRTTHAQVPDPISGYGTINWSPVAVLPATTGTLNGYQLVGLGTVASASPALTLPTARNLCAIFPNPYASQQGFNWDWYVRNDGAGVVSVVTNTGWTAPAAGELRTTAGKVRHYRVGLAPGTCGATSPAAYLYSVGEATP